MRGQVMALCSQAGLAVRSREPCQAKCGSYTCPSGSESQSLWRAYGMRLAEVTSPATVTPSAPPLSAL